MKKEMVLYRSLEKWLGDLSQGTSPLCFICVGLFMSIVVFEPQNEENRHEIYIQLSGLHRQRLKLI